MIITDYKDNYRKGIRRRKICPLVEISYENFNEVPFQQV